MSCSDRRRVLAALAATGLLAGCFRPMLAEGGPGEAMRHRVALPPVNGRMGYHLRAALEDRLGEPRDPDHRLEVRLKEETRGLAIAQDNSVTRITLVLTADWALYRGSATKPVLTDRLVAQAGYNSTGSLFATREADLDVQRRLAREVGQRISRSILARAGTLTGAASG